MNMNMTGFVDIYGQEINHNIAGAVDLCKSETTFTLHAEDKIYSIKDPNGVYTKAKRYRLTENEKAINNVKLQFVSYFGNLNKSTNKNILEECITDKEGYYYPMLENGEYSVNIIGGKYNRTIHNKKFETNLFSKFFIDINGLVSKRNGGTLSICNTDYKLIIGAIENQNKLLTPSEIIVSNGETVFVKYITDENGKYRFALKPGIYDVRIKSDKYFKIVRNVNFTENDDFIKLIIGD